MTGKKKGGMREKERAIELTLLDAREDRNYTKKMKKHNTNTNKQ